MDSSEKIIKTLSSAGKPMKAGEIAEASGVEKKEVDKVIKKLVTEGKLHSPVRCFYDIKK
ncbi:MAG: MarR family transcriptional regulator [Bacteroidales bacterium]